MNYVEYLNGYRLNHWPVSFTNFICSTVIECLFRNLFENFCDSVYNLWYLDQSFRKLLKNLPFLSICRTLASVNTGIGPPTQQTVNNTIQR